MEQKNKQNLVGPKIRKLRVQKNLTQDELAARCQLRGFDIARATLSKVEAQLRCVTDKELLLLAKVFKVKVDDLYYPLAEIVLALQGKKHRARYCFAHFLHCRGNTLPSVLLGHLS